MAGPQLSRSDRAIRDQRIVEAIAKGASIKCVASRFGVSVATARKAFIESKQNNPALSGKRK